MARQWANDSVEPGILIVEDEPLIASYIKEVLTEAEFHVAGIASSASEALSLLDHCDIELALIDIRLTGPLDGIELACLIRGKRNIPTIFLSGLTDHETKLRAVVARPIAFLQKPFLPSRLFNAIELAKCSAAEPAIGPNPWGGASHRTLGPPWLIGC